MSLGTFPQHKQLNYRHYNEAPCEVDKKDLGVEKRRQGIYYSNVHIRHFFLNLLAVLAQLLLIHDFFDRGTVPDFFVISLMATSRAIMEYRGLFTSSIVPSSFTLQ
jgi:hypothetical protein